MIIEHSTTMLPLPPMLILLPNDDYSGSNFQANEGRDSFSTSGSYSVSLPNDHTQTVNYNVPDAYSGYIASSL